ncbi:hypothetical protein L6452_20395 [Arctium lappa]|uniref:Uncharacterized protein n=1 Tax=Arctium lappa TaxID=4217 RepID=A0ACB9BB96_ARCLA|nr:hypothetical protein L6452_20395 [Arctium lappa]
MVSFVLINNRFSSRLINRPQRGSGRLISSPTLPSLSHTVGCRGSSSQQQVDSHNRLVLRLCFSVLCRVTLFLSLSLTQ